MIYKSPIGDLYITENAAGISGVFFASRRQIAADNSTSALTECCAQQLDAYFAGDLQEFDLPLSPVGTEFQMRVWQGLQQIPYGTTWTYKQLAQTADCPRGYRAVGLANNRNPISIIIPCHRVIGADGSLTGYGGGLDMKRFLLQLEQDALIGADTA